MRTATQHSSAADADAARAANKRPVVVTAGDPADAARRDVETLAYAVSHDLSEPLRAMAGPLALLAAHRPELVDAEARVWLDFAQEGCARMQSMIDDLLAYSRVGRFYAPVPGLDLRRVFEAAVVACGPRLAHAGATVSCGPLPAVTGDASQLQDVFQRLLDNAVRFARPGVPAVITATARRHGDDLVVSISDNGEGIAPAYRDRVFGVFYQLRSRTPGVDSGNGIGLALVRRVVEQHGGSVGISDTDDRTGCRVWFTLRRD